MRLGDGYATGLSPDGRFALSLLPTSPSRLLLLPTGAGEPITLNRGTLEEYTYALWFPDGQRVLIEGNEPGRPSRLFVQDSMRRTAASRAAGERGPRRDQVQRHAPGRPLGGRHCGGQRRPASPSTPWMAVRRGPSRASCPATSRCGGVRTGARSSSWRPARCPRRSGASTWSTGARVPWKTLGPTDVAGVRGLMNIMLSADGNQYCYQYERVTDDLYLVEGLR